MSFHEDAGPVAIVRRVRGEGRILQRQLRVRRPRGLARGLVAGATVVLVALAANPATAATSTTTGPSGCHHQPGIECPGGLGPLPIASVAR